MVEKNWTTQFPNDLDSNTNMPTLAPGDAGLITQPNALKNAIIQIENVLGSNNLESGSVRKKVADLETNSASKDLLDSYAKLSNWPGTQALLDGYAPASGGGYAEKALLDSYATVSNWPGVQSLFDSYAKLSSWPGTQALLDGYAPISGGGYAEKILLDSYARLSSWPGAQYLFDSYATIIQLNMKADKTLLDAYATTVQLDLKASQTLLDSYAKLSNWPGTQSLLDSYATIASSSLLTTKGDIYTYTTTNARLGVSGNNGYVLTEDSTALTGLKWAAAGTASPLTTKGDLYTYSTTNDKLAVGTNNYVLTANSGETTGLKWADARSLLTVAADGYISFSGKELDPAVTTGSETQIVLPYAPVDGYSVSVYRNGLLMRRVAALGSSKQEYTISGKTVNFVASGSSGDWYLAQDIDGYSVANFIYSSISATKTTTYTANYGEIVKCNPTSAGFTVMIPTPVGNERSVITIKNVSNSTNTITLSAVSGLIDGSSAQSLSGSWASATLVSDGTDWIVI